MWHARHALQTTTRPTTPAAHDHAVFPSVSTNVHDQRHVVDGGGWRRHPWPRTASIGSPPAAKRFCRWPPSRRRRWAAGCSCGGAPGPRERWAPSPGRPTGGTVRRRRRATSGTAVRAPCAPRRRRCCRRRRRRRRRRGIHCRRRRQCPASRPRGRALRAAAAAAAAAAALSGPPQGKRRGAGGGGGRRRVLAGEGASGARAPA